MKTLSDAHLSPCPDSLSNDQIEQFKNDGYLAFSEVLSPEEVERSCEAMRRVTHELVTDSGSVYSPPRAGSGSKGNQGGASYQRPDSLSMLQLEAGYDPSGKPVPEIESYVRKYMWFCDEDPVFQKMLSSESKLSGIVRAILGRDPILFQQMALVKPPFVGKQKPWHQDNAYFSVTPLDAILGVWIALDDAGVENGCMHVIPGGHKEGGFQHHHGLDCEIAPELLATERSTPVPVPAGGAMFFYGMLPHETPPNRTALKRRALQFHFRGANTQIINEEAYDRIFVDRSGRASSCRAASRLGF